MSKKSGSTQPKIKNYEKRGTFVQLTSIIGKKILLVDCEEAEMFDKQGLRFYFKHEPEGELFATFTTSKPLIRAIKELKDDFAEGYMVAAVIKEQKSKRNPAFKYYVLESPE
ncbi:MAG: hypothetical protein DRJ03_08110 [Chloroflexi bacterium]|nr:MAG: hypothetical protein DRJ03_08110 [Chloroflexota bacterium]